MMPKQTELQSTKRKRNKCHGNRKLRRFRKRCQINRMKNPFTETLMDTVAVIQQFRPNDQPSNEEQDEQIDNQSCLNQHQSMKENYRRQTRTGNLSIDQWKLSTKLIPNYSKFPHHLFKHLLCKAIPCYRHQIQQHLTNPKLLSFIQQYAHLKCTIFQLEMEKDYWKHVINGVLPAVNWLSRMPKDLTRRYSINWDYPRTENNIRHRQQLTENKLEQTNQELYLHLQQYSSCWSISDKTSIDQIMSIISQALIVVIQNGLQKLHTNFEQKKILIQFDVYDVDLLKSFYDSNPTEEQKLQVQKIWRVKFKSCKQTIQQIHTNSLDNEQVRVPDDTSSTFKGNNRLYIDYDNQQDQVSFLESLKPFIRTIIETRQANMEQRTQQILTFNNRSPSQ